MLRRYNRAVLAAEISATGPAGGGRPRPRAQAWLRLLAGAALLAGGAHGLDPSRALHDYGHAAWTTDAGLPQSSVQAVVQTRDGFLWIGTAEGLARFDGIRFAVFDSSNTPELGGADIGALLEARDGSLWIGAYGRGPVRYRDGVFRSFGARDALASVTSLAEDASGRLWVGTDAGVYRQAGEGFEPVPGTAARGAVRSLLGGGDGRLWIGTTQGLGELREGALRWRGEPEGLGNPQVLAMARDARGRVWIGTAGGLLVLERGRLVPASTGGGAGQAVRALLSDREGSLWIGGDHGLSRLRDGRVAGPLASGGLTHSRVLALAEDREGSLWVGTYAGGLNQLKDSSLLTYTSAHGLAADDVGSVAVGRGGAVYVGLDGGEVYRLEGDRLRPLGAAVSGGGAAVGALHEDRRGRLWVGSERGLLRLDGGRWRRFTEKDGVPEVNVRAVLQDSAGSTWVGTEGAGAVRLDASDAPTALTSREGLPSDQVRAFLEDRAGTLWIATYGGLVASRDGELRVLTTRDGLSSDLVRTLHEDADGVLWIGTYGGGLVRRGSDGRFSRFRARDGLFSDVIYAIVEDGGGRLWMSCNKGFFSVEKAALEAFSAGRVPRIVSTAYGRADGMLSVECTGGSPAGGLGRDGRLLFATVRGLVSADLARLGRGSRPPAPVFTLARLDGAAHDRPADLAAPPGTRRVEVEYASLSFLAPERLRFQRRLEGFDADWSAPTARRVAEYTNLPPGEYRFAVRVLEEGGRLGGVASLPVRVGARWYQTRAFAIATLGGLALFAWSAYRVRLRVVEARARALEARVDDAVARLRILRGLLPICSSCKKIRDDKGYWSQLEQYIHEHSEAEFTHGLCPDCAARLYPEIRKRPGPAG